MFDERNTQYVNVRMNGINAYNLIQSMKRAQTKKSSRNQIQKDKSSERKLGKKNRVLATDLSDAYGYVADALYGAKLYERTYGI